MRKQDNPAQESLESTITKRQAFFKVGASSQTSQDAKPALHFGKLRVDSARASYKIKGATRKTNT